jgi:hypothetical protein
MTLTAEGIVDGRHVELDCEPGLPKGARVRLIIETAESDAPDRRAQVAALAGCCADDPDFIDALREIEEQRRRNPPRQVDFDVAP